MMDAVKFIEERNRMCTAHKGGCAGCPANGDNCFVSLKSSLFAGEQVKIVEKWSAAHPRKTRQSVFLEQWPEAEISFTDGCLTLDPCKFYKKMRKECVGKLCSDCRREFWMQEVE